MFLKYFLQLFQNRTILRRNHSVEQKQSYGARIGHSTLVAEKSSTSSGLAESKGSARSHVSTIIAGHKGSKIDGINPFNFFQRLKYRKRDKIKANVDQKIRAVRAAEALDRQTNLRRGE